MKEEGEPAICGMAKGVSQIAHSSWLVLKKRVEYPHVSNQESTG